MAKADDENLELETELEEPIAVEETPEASEPAEGGKRGRPVKEPPPPKRWKVEGTSPEGVRVILGRFTTREEAEPEFERMKQDGFYEKLRIVESKDIPEPSSAA